jgi:hypothetical protein
LELVASTLPSNDWCENDDGPRLTIDLSFATPADFPAWLEDAERLIACSNGHDVLCRLGDDPVVSAPNIGIARLFSNEHHIRIVATHEAESDRFVLGQALLAPLIGPALRPWGLLVLHACAVDWQGRAILFPAASRSGKSTLALALVRAGFRLLSDDSPILRRDPDGSLRLLAYPEPMRVLPDSLARFPETRAAHTEASGLKRLLDPAQLYDDPYVESSTPDLIILPKIADRPSSSVNACPPGQALTELVSGIAFGSTGRTMARDLPMLAQLVRSCRTYALDTGSDFDRLPNLLRDLL